MRSWGLRRPFLSKFRDKNQQENRKPWGLCRAQILASSAQCWGPERLTKATRWAQSLPERPSPRHLGHAVGVPSQLLRMLSGFWGSQASLGKAPLPGGRGRTSLALSCGRARVRAQHLGTALNSPGSPRLAESSSALTAGEAEGQRG